MCPTFYAEAALPATVPATAPPLYRHWSATVLTMTGGPTSKASRALADVRLQLKAGKTRKGRPLEQEEITALEQKRDLLTQAEHQGWLLVFSHGHETKAGYLERRGDLGYLRPVDL